jgi:hypothetical protein
MKQIYSLIAFIVLTFSAAQAGPVITFSANGFNVTSAPETLPVIFNSFYATKNNSNVQLCWSTAREYNNSNYELQRSFDGGSWTTIALLLGTGNSTTVQQYSFTDKNMTASLAYYRIRQVNIDGEYEYSTIKTIGAGETTSATKIYRSGSKVNIEFNREINDPVTVRVINMNGQLISWQEVQQAAYRLTVNLNNNITGVLVVQLKDNAGWNEVKKLVF